MSDKPCISGRSKHCPHAAESWTNTLGTAGGVRHLCCWCGVTCESEWEAKRDPKHGPFIPQFHGPADTTLLPMGLEIETKR